MTVLSPSTGTHHLSETPPAQTEVIRVLQPLDFISVIMFGFVLRSGINKFPIQGYTEPNKE